MLPIMKKFPGNVCSFKLLYDKSNTSNTGNAPNPLGNVFNRLIDTLRIRNFGIEDNETGSSSIWLLATFRISKLMRLAIPGGIMDILLWLSVIRVTFSMLTERKNFEKWAKDRIVLGSDEGEGETPPRNCWCRRFLVELEFLAQNFSKLFFPPGN